MKKSGLFVAVLFLWFGANAQVNSGESYLGGTFSITSQEDPDITSISIIPQYHYAINGRNLVGGGIGIVSTSFDSGLTSNETTNFVLFPNYTRLFPIEGDFFWLLNGYIYVGIGDADAFTPGIAPGLGYRIHDRVIVLLRPQGISYDFQSKDFALSLGPSSLGVSAYIRIGG